MISRRGRTLWLVGAIMAAAATAAPAGALPLPLTALALAITWGVLPGAWIARRLAADQPSDVRVALALLVSPLACGAALVAARQAGANPTHAAQGISGVLALLAAGESLRPTQRADDAHDAEDARPGWWIALGFGALLLLAHAVHPALTERSDGSFHAGIVRVIERGLPPEDPFFAGLPLRYAWGLHAWAAGWLALSPRLDAYTPLVWASAGAAVSALLVVAALARRFGASPGTAMLAQVLALAGASPFGWLVLAARALHGDIRGAAELAPALGNGADQALRALDPGSLHPSLVLPLDKFVVLTPFALALAGGAVALRAVAAWYDTRSLRALACLTLALATTSFAHPFAGLTLGFAFGFGILLALPARGSRQLLAGLLVALVVAVVVTLPYLHALVPPAGPGGVGSRFAWSRAGLFSVLVVGMIVLPMAFRELVAGARREAMPRVVLGALMALVLPALIVRLEVGNQSKFLSIAFLLASAPAAVGWARLAPGLRRAAAIALAVAVGPTLAATLWAYVHQGPLSVDAPSRPPDAILTAVRQWVPRDAILVDATLDSTRGAAPALPGETGRSLLWGGGFMRKWWYSRADLNARSHAAYAIERGAPFARPARLAPERELWLIVPDTVARATDPRERFVARASGVSLVRLANQPHRVP